MIVGFGGGTVDITTCKQLDRITERARDFCESMFIDVKFIKYLRNRLRDKLMNSLRDNNYRQMQINFVNMVK